MSFFIGVAEKARKIIGPYIGVSKKARRVMRAWVGVADKARLFYTYLDDIDYIEVELQDLQVYTDITSAGGVRKANGKSACSSYGTSISKSGNAITISIANQPAEYCVYCHFRYRIVLKDNHKVMGYYPVANDAKTFNAGVVVSNFVYTTSRGYYDPALYIFGNDHTKEGTYTHNASSSNSSGFIRLELSSGQTLARCTYTFGNVVLNGKTYTPTILDSIAA